MFVKSFFATILAAIVAVVVGFWHLPQLSASSSACASEESEPAFAGSPLGRLLGPPAQSSTIHAKTGRTA